MHIIIQLKAMFYGKQAKRKTAPKHLKNGLVMRFLLWSW
nr:MAG TPA: hypothetical protein [Bacteriophage sp.]